MTIDLRSLFLGSAVAVSLFLGYSFRPTPSAENYTYLQFTTVESVVPGGLGRSRVIISDQGDQEVGKDLLNFYSLVGINFKNIANNDRVILDRLNDYQREGWELFSVNTGVVSPTWKTSGSNSSINGSMSDGIFITRYLLRRPL